VKRVKQSAVSEKHGKSKYDSSGVQISASLNMTRAECKQVKFSSTVNNI
jgi:hypothetical protein